MKIRLHAFDLPLTHTFTISRESITSQATLIVELTQDGVSGYGEATSNKYYGFTIERMTYTNATLFLPMAAVRTLHRRRGLSGEADAKQEISVPAGPINAVMSGALFLESAWLRWFDCPFGRRLKLRRAGAPVGIDSKLKVFLPQNTFNISGTPSAAHAGATAMHAANAPNIRVCRFIVLSLRWAIGCVRSDAAKAVFESF